MQGWQPPQQSMPRRWSRHRRKPQGSERGKKQLPDGVPARKGGDSRRAGAGGTAPQGEPSTMGDPTPTIVCVPPDRGDTSELASASDYELWLSVQHITAPQDNQERSGTERREEKRRERPVGRRNAKRYGVD